MVCLGVLLGVARAGAQGVHEGAPSVGVGAGVYRRQRKGKRGLQKGVYQGAA